MAERWAQQRRVGKRRAQRFGRARRHDAIATGYDDQRRVIETLRRYRLAGDAPFAARRSIVAIPGASAKSRATPPASGTPSLSQSSSATKSRAATLSGSSPAKRMNFSLARNGSSGQEEALDHPKRQRIIRCRGPRPTARANPACSGRSQREIPGVASSAIGGRCPGAALRQGQRQQAAHGSSR